MLIPGCVGHSAYNSQLPLTNAMVAISHLDTCRHFLPSGAASHLMQWAMGMGVARALCLHC